MTTVHMFPGQGAQHVGMGERVLSAYPNLVRSADSVLGYSVAELCLQGPPARLVDTRHAQCALYVVEALSYLDAVRRGGVLPDVVAGHSVGEYAALFAAGAYTFEAGLRVVAKRADLMASAGPGAMAAVLGVDEERVRELIRRSGSTLDVAAVNAADHVVVSGRAAELAGAVPLLSQVATNVVPLDVSGPFHSRHLAEAAREFEVFLRGCRMSRLRIPVIANATGRPHTDGTVASTLARQLVSPVRWSDTVNHLLDLPDPHFHEIGPSGTLGRLVERARATR